MHQPKIAAFALCALALGGCAHEIEAPEPRPEALPASAAETPSQPEPAPGGIDTASPESPGAAPAVAALPKPKLIRPADDPRYALPPANQRSLSIFLGSQTFEYLEDGAVFASGQVSTGTAEHPTPTGSFRVLSKDENKRSGKYTNFFNDNTPMPYSLQFYGPYFVHEGWVPGYADSHGCVRLHYEDARLIYNRIRIGDPVVVKQQGKARTTGPLPDMIPVF